MSSSVMPWYTRVSFHTGFRVLRSVFVLSLFDCGVKQTRRNYSPESFPAQIPAPGRDAPSHLAHLGDGEAAAPGEHQGGILQWGLVTCESFDFVTPWGLFPQGEGKKVLRAGCGGSDHSCHGLKEVTAGN